MKLTRVSRHLWGVFITCGLSLGCGGTDEASSSEMPTAPTGSEVVPSGAGTTAATSPGSMLPGAEMPPAVGAGPTPEAPASTSGPAPVNPTPAPGNDPTANDPVPSPDAMGTTPLPEAEPPGAEPEPSGTPTPAVEPVPDTPTAEVPAGETAPIISAFSIEPNPNSEISAYVNWTTDVAASAEVHFGVGDVEFRVRSPEAGTEHRVLVIGMYEETEYVIRAVAANTAGSSSEDGSFSTGSLPNEVPIPELTANEPASSQAGWTLTNIMVGSSNGGFGSTSPAIAVIYDEAGIPVWYYVNGTTSDGRGDISMDYLNDGTILIGPAPGESPRQIDLGGNIIWEGPPQSGGGFGGGGGGGVQMSHHAGMISNGNIVILRDPQSNGLTGALIEEYDPSNNMVVWSWDLLENTTPPASASGDWCHGNSITVDLDADAVYLNCRFLGMYKIRRSDGDILWHMGGTLTPDVPGDVTYPVPGSQFSDAHDPEMHDDGTILLYDNGGYAGLGGGVGNYHSRVLEYQMDETAKEATLVWEFPGDFAVDSWYVNDWYAAFWGDADRLDNDNVLVTAGLKDAALQTRIFEVTRQGEVVWEITLPPNQGSYRAQRFPPLVERLP